MGFLALVTKIFKRRWDILQFNNRLLLCLMSKMTSPMMETVIGHYWQPTVYMRQALLQVSKSQKHFVGMII